MGMRLSAGSIGLAVMLKRILSGTLYVREIVLPFVIFILAVIVGTV
jgi:hypothetical protein